MGITGAILVAADASAGVVGWTSLAVGMVWLAAVVFWVLGAPPTHPDGNSGGWAGLGRATYREPGDDRSQRQGG
jgi:hypothetical protein